MKLEIISPEGIVYQGETNRVWLPGEEGGFDILPRHAPLIAALREGSIRYENEKQEKEMKIRGGFVEVKEDTISACIEPTTSPS